MKFSSFTTFEKRPSFEILVFWYVVVVVLQLRKMTTVDVAKRASVWTRPRGSVNVMSGLSLSVVKRKIDVQVGTRKHEISGVSTIALSVFFCLSCQLCWVKYTASEDDNFNRVWLKGYQWGQDGQDLRMSCRFWVCKSQNNRPDVQ